MQLPFVSRKRYKEVVYKLECLLCHVTGGRLSKAGYDLRVMESCANEHLDECIDEALAEVEAERRWIPVDERLPQEGVNVLVALRIGDRLTVDTDRIYGGRWFAYGSRGYRGSGYVTHWMPLPNHPKEKRKETQK
jgi:hypothetical protein